MILRQNFLWQKMWRQHCFRIRLLRLPPKCQSPLLSPLLIQNCPEGAEAAIAEGAEAAVAEGAEAALAEGAEAAVAEGAEAAVAQGARGTWSC